MSEDFMGCKARAARQGLRDPNGGQPCARSAHRTAELRRRLILGDVYHGAGQSALSVNCKVISKPAENAAAPASVARDCEGTIDAQQFYPASAKRQGIEGDAVVRY